MTFFLDIQRSKKSHYYNMHVIVRGVFFSITKWRPIGTILTIAQYILSQDRKTSENLNKSLNIHYLNAMFSITFQRFQFSLIASRNCGDIQSVAQFI